MKTSLLFILFFAVAFTAPIAQNEEDDDCSIVWIAVDGNGPEPSATALSSSTAEAPVVTPTVISSSASETISTSASQNKIVDTSSSFQALSPASDIKAVRTASSKSAASASSGSKQSLPVSMPTRLKGDAGFPVHGDHLSAPQAKDTVPTGAAIYTVPDGKNFNGTEFRAWMFKQNDAKLASKFIKIAPGTYNFDTNDNIQIFWISDDWTFDFRDVTLLVSITDAHPETNQAIYIGQCKGLTILGGTIWFDQGEQWTQAKVISTSPIGNNDGQLATLEVQEGYNVSAWTTAGPRNQGCVDISNPNHYTRPDCNFWYSNTYDFSQLNQHPSLYFPHLWLPLRHQGSLHPHHAIRPQLPSHSRVREQQRSARPRHDLQRRLRAIWAGLTQDGHFRGRMVCESTAAPGFCTKSEWSDVELGTYWAV